MGAEVECTAPAPGHAGLEDDLVPEGEHAKVEDVATPSVRRFGHVAIERNHGVLEELDLAAVPDSSAILWGISLARSVASHEQ